MPDIPLDVGDISGHPVTASNTETISKPVINGKWEEEPVQGKISRPYPSTNFRLEEHPVDERRGLRVRHQNIFIRLYACANLQKVGVIGAGLTGITAGILLPVKVPGIQLKIYEKNKDVVSNPITTRPRICSKQSSNLLRAELGMRTYIRGFVVTSRPTCIRARLNLTRSGRKNMPRAMRY